MTLSEASHLSGPASSSSGKWGHLSNSTGYSQASAQRWQGAAGVRCPEGWRREENCFLGLSSFEHTNCKLLATRTL